MILFSKKISVIYSLNFFSPEEKNFYKNDINKLYSFFDETKIHNIIEVINKDDFFKALSEINNKDQTGILINFIGHGGNEIGNHSGLRISWEDIISHLQDKNSEDNLVINTSIMCNGNQIFEYKNVRPKAFYAAFGTNGSTNAQSFSLTVQILKNCLKHDYIKQEIQIKNEILAENSFPEFDQRAGYNTSGSTNTQFQFAIAEPLEANLDK